MDSSSLPPPWDHEHRAVERLRSGLLPPTGDAVLDWPTVQDTAHPWLTHLRAHPPAFWAMESLLQAYPLSSSQGLALMRLAEALLRVPDADTAQLLLSDQLAHGRFTSDTVNTHGSHPWWEALSHKVLTLAARWSQAATPSPAHTPATSADDDTPGALRSVMDRLGQQATVRATLHALQLLGRQFVLATDIEAAWRDARQRSTASARDGAHTCWSFDMLGEGARTWADADRYLAAYEHALNHLSAHGDAAAGQGLSIKLSALHPRLEERHGPEVIPQILPRVLPLATLAAHHGLLLTLDAEESDRLELQLRVLGALLDALSAADQPKLQAWEGLGMAVQAYQFRAPAVIRQLVTMSQQHGRRLTVRLVKGAYWDGEIKRAQEMGLPGYPVYARKAHTDLSYLACARQLLQHTELLRPQFATHNAVTVAAVMQMARQMGVPPTLYEWQRLHGMGEATYQCIRQHTPAQQMAPVRIYAPVGPHRELLAYLVRRLLENGANSSFVHQLAEPDTSLDQLLAPPWLAPADAPLPPPCEAWAGPYAQAPGRDLSDASQRQMVLAPLNARLALGAAALPAPPPPMPPSEAGAVMSALQQAWPAWEQRPWDDRADILERVANQLEHDLDDWAAELVLEARKTLDDAVAEVRETIDLARYYALQARHLGCAQNLPGPTGELNRWQVRGRGVFVCIAPWNFPLAIFGGQVMAALVTGNTVAAKSAPQTPRVGERLVCLLHACGVPHDALRHAAGDGQTGAALVAHPLCAGVAFTGSCDTAKRLQRSLAEGHRPIVPLLAETGGINAMIVDSTALPEQVVDTVVHSAFHSAGQRCSALRLLCVHHAVAPGIERMLAGAMQVLRVGRPEDWTTDIGPVIDADAAERLQRWERTLESRAQQAQQTHHGVQLLARTPMPAALAHDPRQALRPLHWVAPSAWRLPDVASLSAEHFGPILHVVHWGSGTSAPSFEVLVDQINAQGYGLTMGLHTRMDGRVDKLAQRARVGNLYVNRGMTGAVVGSQPFGGQGWSGTGPKAGGPWYLTRFTTEQVVSVNTTAAGGNATLLASFTR